MERALLDSARITRSGKRTLSATEVHAPEQGAYRSISLLFPKTDPLTPDDKDAEVYAAAQPFEFRHKFPLKNMVYGGVLAL